MFLKFKFNGWGNLSFGEYDVCFKEHWVLFYILHLNGIVQIKKIF